MQPARGVVVQKSTVVILFLLVSWVTCDGMLATGQASSTNGQSAPAAERTGGCNGGLQETDGPPRADSGAPNADQKKVTADLVAAAPTGDRAAPDRVKPDLRAPSGTPDSKPAPTADARPILPDSQPAPKPDTLPPPPPPTGPLPTWVPLDWAAFPVDPGPSYSVAGKTWVVRTSGNDGNAGTEALPLQTIVAALGKAQPGDLVLVHGGSYAEGTPGDWRALVMDKDNVILTAAPSETVNVTGKSGYTYGLALIGSNLVVNGINLSGFTPSIELGSETKTQQNLVITNLTVTAPTGVFSDGIVDYADTVSKGFPNIKGLLLKNVKVLGASLSISCNSGPCSSWRLENVVVKGGGGGAGNSGSDAIAVENGDNHLFYKVDVSGAAADGIDTKATRVVVWDSHVHDIARNGVKLWWGGDIVNTLVHHTGADCAVNVKMGERVRILNSTIAYHNYQQGTSYNMAFRYDDNGPVQVDIINSIIYNTSGGAYFSTNAKVNISNSLFYGMENGTILEHGSTTIQTSDSPSIFQTKGLGSNNLIADPGLGADFIPKSGSCVANKGQILPTLFPTEDLDGCARVKSGLPDLGPYEVF
jgi:hypothetical protein